MIRSKHGENTYIDCQSLQKQIRRKQTSLLLEVIRTFQENTGISITRAYRSEIIYIYKLADGNNELLNKDQVLQA